MSEPTDSPPESHPRLSSHSLGIFLPLLVLVVCLIIVYQLWQNERHKAESDRKSEFDFSVHLATSHLKQRMAAYEQVLHGADGLIGHDDIVRHDEFHNYIMKQHLAEDFPGMLSIGYAQIVPRAVNKRHASSLQSFSQTAIEPDGQQDIYTSILYVEPHNETNHFFGYDLYSEPVLRAAMESARDADKSTITSRVLVEPVNNQPRLAGFLMFLPVYKKGALHNSLVKRRASIIGWVYAPFRTDVLMKNIFSEISSEVDIEIYDGEYVTESNQLYDPDNGHKDTVPWIALFKTAKAVEIGGHTWTVVARSLPGLEARLDTGKPQSIAIAGIIMSLLLALLTWQLVTGRSRALQAARKMNQDLIKSEQLWSFALEGGGDCVWDWNLATGKLTLSKSGKYMFGFAEDEIVDEMSAWQARVHPDDMPKMLADLKSYLGGHVPMLASEYRVMCKDGSWKWIYSRGKAVGRDEYGKVERMIGTHSDISARKASEELLWKQANFDFLTGLPNRNMFHGRLQLEIRKAHRKDKSLALLLLDLDNFKEVNDALGHDMGDILLKEAALRLAGCVRESDTVARLGGDEFTVIIGELLAPGYVERAAQNILQKMSEPFLLGSETIFLSTSIGITVYPGDAVWADELIKNADQAMYTAKKNGRNRYHYFTPSMQEAAQVRRRMVGDLRIALAGDQFRVYYQPIVDMATGAIHKAEALIRWQHPVRGLVGPVEFIPIAEETGMIIDIGSWVFEEAAHQAKHWRASYHAEFQISVNKSPVQFNHAGAKYDQWFDYLKKIGLPGQGIVIEITEGLLLNVTPATTGKLLTFRDGGIQVALDDFGTGYSSLSYLKKFDIDYLKIDRSFVMNLAHGSDDMALCEAIIAMAHKLNMKVIAEGVETKEQRDLLAAAGCDYAQGYLYSKPVPAHEFELLLERQLK